VLVLYCLGALYGTLALLVPHLPRVAAYAMAGILVAGGLGAVFFLESVPYERQMKIKKSEPKPELGS
jgi:hypothetical protein